MRNRMSAAALGLGLALTLAACGGGDAFEGGAGGTSAPTSGGETSLTVGGASFTEMLIMQEMYKLVLEKAGYTVDMKAVEGREIYAPALVSGDIDVVPDYAASMTEYLNEQKNGAGAPLLASNDIATTMEALRPLAEEKGLVALEPAGALDANAFVVSKDFAAKNKVSTLSELGALGRELVLAAGEDCPTRPFCQPGLEKTYGLKLKINPLGFGSVNTKDAVRKGTADLGLTGTTDGTLDTFGLVALEDDKGLQLADNLVPLVNKASAGDEKVAAALNELSGVLSTDDLKVMNVKVDVDREKPADVAREYLTSKGLL